MGQIWLHIGSPKTGTTAIQGFLSQNAEVLRASGRLNFVQAGRGHIAHNQLVAAIRSGEAAPIFEAIAREADAMPQATHIVSSELLFNHLNARKMLACVPDEMKGRVKVLCYLRRQDAYLEALYKQMLKNSRISPDRQAFMADAGRRVRYLETLNWYAKCFGKDAILLRPFDRKALVGGDVVDDFAAQVGLEMTPDLVRATDAANKTFSVEMSELLSNLGTHTQVNTREVIRELIRLDRPGTVKSRDVFTRAERLAYMESLSDENSRLMDAYDLGDPDFFDLSDLKDAPDEDPAARTEAALQDRIAAQEALFEAIGNLQNREDTQPPPEPEPAVIPTWYDEIFPAGTRDGFYHKTGPYSCSFVDRGAQQLVVTFDNLHSAGNPSHAREPWAQKFCADQGYSHLGVYAQSPTWFRHMGVIDYLQKLSRDGFFAGFERTALAGTSMGGFAALTFASLAPGATVLAFSPQTTLKAELVPWEKRFAKGRAADWSLPHSDAAQHTSTASKVYVIYDPFNEADSAQIERLRGDNILRLKSFGFGHKSALVLNRMGVLKTVMQSGIEGTLSDRSFYPLIRGRKDIMLYRREMEAYFTARGQEGRAQRFAQAFKRRRQAARSKSA